MPPKLPLKLSVILAEVAGSSQLVLFEKKGRDPGRFSRREAFLIACRIGSVKQTISFWLLVVLARAHSLGKIISGIADYHCVNDAHGFNCCLDIMNPYDVSAFKD